MKSKILKMVAIFILSLSLVSCGASKTASQEVPQTTTELTEGYTLGFHKSFSGDVFQTFNKDQALVELHSTRPVKPLVYLVKPTNSNLYFFDGLSIRSGQYVFIGIHRYQNETGRYRTVPVFIEKESYEKGMVWDDKEMKIKKAE